MKNHFIVVVALLFLSRSDAFRLNQLVSKSMKSRYKSFFSSSAGPDIPAIAVEDFPILNQEVHLGKRLIYFDSAASSQKPSKVIDRMSEYYQTSHSNVHRGAHTLAVRATDQFEAARYQVQSFINAEHREEVVFTKGATDAINLVALSWGNRLRPGDEIILTIAEHHANLVPWQMLAQRTGAVLKFVGLTENMELDIDQYKSLLSSKTKLVAFAHASNVLGSINPVQEMVIEAKKVGAIVLLDACQTVPHMPVDVQALGVDFLVASSHKMCGPTGIGFLYGKKALLESMPPVMGGGEMIDVVQLESSTYAAPPSRFEAGTPAIAEAIGLGAACEYLATIGMQRIHDHETQLGGYLYNRLTDISSLSLYGPSTGSSSSQRTGLVSFNDHTIHATDLAFFLDQEGIAVRTGHHCAQPLHRHLKIPGSIRASLYFYNSQDEIDIFIMKLKDTIEMFRNM